MPSDKARLDWLEKNYDRADGERPEQNTNVHFAADGKTAVPEWMPIETAPKDRTKYILVTAGRGAWIAHWDPVATSGYRFDQPWRSVMLNHDHIAPTARHLPPTHWMPLPPPPTTDGTPRKGDGEKAALGEQGTFNE